MQIIHLKTGDILTRILKQQNGFNVITYEVMAGIHAPLGVFTSFRVQLKIIGHDDPIMLGQQQTIIYNTGFSDDGIENRSFGTFDIFVLGTEKTTIEKVKFKMVAYSNETYRF